MKRLSGIFLCLIAFTVIMVNLSQAAPPKTEKCLTCHASATTLEKLMPKEEAAAKEGGGEG